MAKKKSRSFKEHIFSPVSLKTSGIIALLFAGLASLNLYTFMQAPSKVIQKEQLVSQQELMNVLGSTIALGDDTQQTYAPFLNKPEVAYWYEILTQKPDYRDAYIMLATLAYNDHHCNLAQSHLNNALRLDPTYHNLIQLKSAISTCQ